MYDVARRAAEGRANLQGVDERIRRQQELEEAQHQAALAVAENARKVAVLAGQAGMSPAAYEQMIFKNMELVAQIVQALMPAQLEAQTYQAKKGIDFEYEQLRAQLAKHMAKVKMMPDLLQLNELHKQFSGLLKEIEAAERMPDSERKEAELGRLRSKERYFREQIERIQDKSPKQAHDFKFNDDEDV
jgi:hypothetical protein